MYEPDEKNQLQIFVAEWIITFNSKKSSRSHAVIITSIQLKLANHFYHLLNKLL